MISSEAAVSDIAVARPVVTQEHVDAYERDGAVCVRGVLPPDEVGFPSRRNRGGRRPQG